MTLAEIARLAGVSRTTASYVINGKAEAHRISRDTVAKVMAVVERHQYRVDAQAAALRRGQSRTLGLIVPDLPGGRTTCPVTGVRRLSDAELAALPERDRP